MELSGREGKQLSRYLSAFDVFMGDQRTQRTFVGVIEGIIGSESLRASQIARFSPHVSQAAVW
jgi:hypothetical protein